MVKAADIGKDAKDFMSKDFFAGNEVKVNLVDGGKHTTTFKLGDAIKADHKIELAKCPLGSPLGPATFKIGSTTDFEAEGKWCGNGAKTTLTLKTNLANVADISKMGISKTFEYTKETSGIKTTFDMKSGLKGFSEIDAVNFGLAFDKQGVQLAMTGAIADIRAPALSKQKFIVGYDACPHFKAAAFTSTGMDWSVVSKLTHNGRTYAVDFDCNKLAGSIGTNMSHGKIKIDTDGKVSSYTKYPVSESCGARFGCAWNMKSGQFEGMGMGLDFSL